MDMSLTSYLTQLNAVKSDIRDAIEAKGVDMDQVPFTEYAAKIEEISGGSGVTEVATNYPGYIINYGEMTLTDIIIKKYIPLTVYLYENAFEVNTTVGASRTVTVKSSSGGDKTFQIFKNTAISDAGKSAIYDTNYKTYLDLLDLYDFNLDDVKNITEISGYHDSLKIVQWLEPDTAFDDGRIYLFKDGEYLNEDISGGFTLTNYSVTDGALVPTAGYSGNFVSKNAIDFTKYKLGIKYFLSNEGLENGQIRASIGSKMLYEAYRGSINIENLTQKAVIDIPSSIDAAVATLMISTNKGYANDKIYAIWLETDTFGEGVKYPELDGTATPEDVLAGKTFYSNNANEMLTGTLVTEIPTPTLTATSMQNANKDVYGGTNLSITLSQSMKLGLLIVDGVVTGSDSKYTTLTASVSSGEATISKLSQHGSPYGTNTHSLAVFELSNVTAGAVLALKSSVYAGLNYKIIDIAW